MIVTLASEVLCVFLSGTVAAAGISQLQRVDLNSSRNLFIIGLSLMFGMSLPVWLREHPHAIDSGIKQMMTFFGIFLFI